MSTVKAIKKSARKWEEIAFNGGVDEGATNCELCKDHCVEEGSCLNCAIAIKVDISGCTLTPFDEFFCHQANCHRNKIVRKVYCEDCFKIAKREMYFILNLLPTKTKLKEKARIRKLYRNFKYEVKIIL